MVETPDEVTGGCKCGAVRYSVAVAPVLTEYCHCESCRRASGAPLMAWAAYDSKGFAATSGNPVEYLSSPGVIRSFCGICGTSLTLKDERFGDIYVAIASLDKAEAVTPEFHIWRSQRLPWLETADDWPRYLRFRFQGELEETSSVG